MPSTWRPALGARTLLLVLLAFSLSDAAVGNNLPDTVKVYDRAQIVIGSRGALPGTVDYRRASEVALPHYWRRDDFDRGNEAWYRLAVSTPDGRSGQAVYLHWFNMNFELFLNGIKLGDGGSITEPVARNWNRPFLIDIPDTVWRDADNTLELRLLTYSPFGRLGQVLVGERSQLAAEYSRAFRLKISAAKVLFCLTFTAGLWVLVLWLLRPQDTLNLWFSMAALAWSVNAFNMFTQWIPLGNYQWDALVHLSIDLWAALVVGFMHRLLRIHRPRVDALALAFAVCGYLASFLLGPEQKTDFANFWHLGAVVLGIYMLIIVGREAWRRRRLRDYTHLLLFSSIFVAGIHDFLWQSQAMTEWQTPLRLIHFPAPLLLVYFAWLLTSKFSHAMRVAEDMTETLDDKVEESRRHLEQAYDRLHQQRLRRAVEQERGGILHRLHEDVGTNLLVLARSPSRGTAITASAILHDLKQVVASRVADARSLDEVANQWQEEIADRLEQSGFEFGFSVEGDVAELTLDRQTQAHLDRIVREAVTNCLKHSRGDSFSLEVAVDDSGLNLHVADNGPCSEPAHTGRGLSGMRHRAEELGARFRCEASAEGFRIFLFLPAPCIEGVTPAPVGETL